MLQGHPRRDGRRTGGEGDSKTIDIQTELNRVETFRLVIHHARGLVDRVLEVMYAESDDRGCRSARITRDRPREIIDGSVHEPQTGNWSSTSTWAARHHPVWVYRHDRNRPRWEGGESTPPSGRCWG